MNVTNALLTPVKNSAYYRAEKAHNQARAKRWAAAQKAGYDALKDLAAYDKKHASQTAGVA